MIPQLTSEAERDVLEAKDWLAERSPGLPERFVSALDDAFHAIVDHPEMYPIVHRSLRRALTKTFPYAVFFTIESKGIVVHAVIHQARHPSSWQRRA